MVNINIFIHGVPRGHKVWGPKEADAQYFGSFYGPKWELDEVMKVEVMTFGGATHTYYTFVKGLNVCDSEGRTGAYFAITMRINAFYANVQNIYNLMSTTFNNRCAGLCIGNKNGHLQFTIGDFSSIDSQLKEIEKDFTDFISKFSKGSQLTNLTGIPANTQGVPECINLQECTQQVAYETIKRSGKFLVSPLYLSKNAARTVEQAKAQVASTKREAQQAIDQQRRDAKAQIDATNKSANEKIAGMEQRMKQERQQSQQEADRKVQDVKNQYADVDQKLQEQKQTISQQNRDLQDKDRANAALQQQNQQLETKNAKLQAKLTEALQKIPALERSLAECKQIANELNVDYRNSASKNADNNGLQNKKGNNGVKTQSNRGSNTATAIGNQKGGKSVSPNPFGTKKDFSATTQKLIWGVVGVFAVAIVLLGLFLFCSKEDKPKDEEDPYYEEQTTNADDPTDDALTTSDVYSSNATYDEAETYVQKHHPDADHTAEEGATSASTQQEGVLDAVKDKVEELDGKRQNRQSNR